MSGFNTILHVETPVLRSELAGEPVGEFQRTGNKQFFQIAPVTGREHVAGQQVRSDVTHQLKCPYFTGANSRMRLTAGDDAANPTRVFNVVGVVNERESNRFLVWQCIEAT